MYSICLMELLCYREDGQKIQTLKKKEIINYFYKRVYLKEPNIFNTRRLCKCLLIVCFTLTCSFLFK